MHPCTRPPGARRSAPRSCSSSAVSSRPPGASTRSPAAWSSWRPGLSTPRRPRSGCRRKPVDSERAAELLAPGEPFVLDHDAEEDACEVTLGRPCAVAPIALDGGRLGSIVITAREGECFSEQQLELLTGIAHQAKLALTNAGNFRNLEQTFLETVEALANACEANDEYTSSHARWITDLSLKVGAGLGLDANQLKRLELGALFHDIGKIGIPQHILQKPG